jgi:hypothetical protein
VAVVDLFVFLKPPAAADLLTASITRRTSEEKSTARLCWTMVGSWPARGSAADALEGIAGSGTFVSVAAGAKRVM